MFIFHLTGHFELANQNVRQAQNLAVSGWAVTGAKLPFVSKFARRPSMVHLY